MDEQYLKTLVETEARSKSNTHRIDVLEKNQEALNNMATSLAVIAEQQKNMADKVDSIDADVKDLKKVPADRWEKIIMTALTVFVTAVVTLAINGQL